MVGLFYKITHASGFKVDNLQTYNTTTLPFLIPLKGFSAPQYKLFILDILYVDLRGRNKKNTTDLNHSTVTLFAKFLG